MRDRDKEYDELLDVWNKCGAFYERYQASYKIPKSFKSVGGCSFCHSKLQTGKRVKNNRKAF